jgi:predicted AAA+ superfamily ATPase
MLSHYHGQVFNASELARSMNLSSPTIQRYLDILSGTFIIRQLQPWFYNAKKRIVKSPKIYFRDSGLLHVFLSIDSKTGLTRVFFLETTYWSRIRFGFSKIW